MVLLRVTDRYPASQETVYGTGFHAQSRLKTAAFVNKVCWTNNEREEPTALPAFDCQALAESPIVPSSAFLSSCFLTWDCCDPQKSLKHFQVSKKLSQQPQRERIENAFTKFLGKSILFQFLQSLFKFILTGSLTQYFFSTWSFRKSLINQQMYYFSSLYS